jgi:adenylosuccinate synthase
VDEVVGVVKAYATRVGLGPFPTELEGPIADYMRRRGNEYGATTGRPRRCGWFDGALTAYASRVNGCSWLALTLLDVLGGLENLRISTGYGSTAGGVLPPARGFGGADPIYEDLRGWTGEISGLARWEDLPDAARSYVDRVAGLAGAPIRLVSTGPDRSEVIWRNS